MNKVTSHRRLLCREIADTLKMHPATAGRCAEKGRKLVDSYEGMWEVLR